jgi:hypothetical protein
MAKHRCFVIDRWICNHYEHFTSSAKFLIAVLLIVALSLNKMLLLFFEMHLFFLTSLSTKIFPLKTPVSDQRILRNLDGFSQFEHAALRYSGLHVAFRQ